LSIVSLALSTLLIAASVAFIVETRQWRRRQAREDDMSGTTHVPSGAVRPRPRADAIWQCNPPLSALVLAMAALIVISAIGLVVDARIITGAPAWMKPLKFAISVAIYGATLLWMLTFIPDRPRLVALMSWGLLLGFAFELILIVVQVLRDTTSHFNRATAFDAAVWNAMAVTIVVMWLLNAVVAVLLARRRFAAPPLRWGVRFGLLIALLGMAVAFLMTRPTPEQTAATIETGSSAIVGAHAVGVADGGPGLPVVGWSTTGGDLRVAHFFGLHGLQALALTGILLERLALGWLAMRERARLVMVVASFWGGLTLLLTWQALRGQPLLQPDAATLATAAIGAAAVAGRAWLTARSAKGRPRRGSWPEGHPACQCHSRPG
jgi:hypothetical protein